MEEISLKDIIVVLLKGWRWILLAMLLFTSAALVYGLTQPRVYASEAVLSVNTIDINPRIHARPAYNDDGGESLLTGNIVDVVKFPVMDINSYTKQLVNIKVLERTAIALGLTDKMGDPLSAGGLRGSITVKPDEKTNTITVTVRGDNPQAAADLANALGEQLRVYLDETIKQNCTEISENVHYQLEVQGKKMSDVTERLKAYAEGPYNAQILESAVESLLSQISRYKTELNDLERSLQADRLALTALRNVTSDDAASSGVSASQFKINIPSAGAGTRYYTASDGKSALGDGGVSPMEIMLESGSDVEDMVLTVKKAELETRLVQNEAEYDALSALLSIMEDDLSQTASTLAEERQRYEILQREYRLANEIHSQYQQIAQQIPVIATSELAWKNIQILSHGSAAAQPENKSALFYAAVGGTLGLFMGIFATLFRSYWSQTSVQT